MAYRMIAIDLDDTLLDSNLDIPDRVRDAINKAVDSGVYVVLCTGRIKNGSWRYHEALGLNTLMITTGGAQIYNTEGTCIYSHAVDPALTKELLTYAKDNDLHVQIYIDDNLVYYEKNKYAQGYETVNEITGIARPDLFELEDVHTPKILFISDFECVNEFQKAATKKFPSISIRRSKPTYLEFSSPGVSKGDALKFVAEYYGVDRSEIIAMGDAEIDIPMIEYAGLGVAMDNATSITKKAADYVCPSNNEGGVADVIEKYILEAQRENKA